MQICIFIIKTYVYKIHKGGFMYIKEEDNKIVIYDVKFDDEIKQIKNELIEKFSEIKTYKEERTSWYNEIYKTKEGMIITLDYYKTGKVREYNDFYSEDEPIYMVEFKEYKYPKLVVYINEFLEGDFSNLPKLKELLIKRKIYRLNDKNREDTLSLLPHKEYIKKVINCIHITKRECDLSSLNKILELLQEDKELESAVSNIKEKLNEDKKVLSYLKEENND